MAAMLTSRIVILVVTHDSVEAGRYQTLLTGLRELPSDVIISTTTASGLARLRKTTPDCILLDHHPPDIDGLQFMSALTARYDISERPPVVLIWQPGSGAFAAEGVAHGAQNYLAKDRLDAATLYHAISGAVEKLNLQRQLDRLEGAKAKVLSVTSTELRAPLGVIREFVSLVRDGVVGTISKTQYQCLGAVLQNCSRVENAINDIITMEQPDSEHQRHHRRKTDVAALLRDCCRQLLPQCQMKYQPLWLRMDDKLPPVLCDPDRTGRVVTDLIARLHMDLAEGESICVRATLRRMPTPDVIIEVANERANDSLKAKRLVVDGHAPSHLAGEGTLPGVTIDAQTIRTVFTGHSSLPRPGKEGGEGRRITVTLPIYTETEELLAFIEDGRKAAHERGARVSVIVVGLPTDAEPLGHPARAEGGRSLVSIDECVSKLLRRREDMTLIAHSERMVIVLAEAHPELGALPLRGRIEEAFAQELGQGHGLRITSGVIGMEEDVGEWLAQLRVQSGAPRQATLARRVLIVDGDSEVLETLSRALESSRHSPKVAVAPSGHLACQLFDLLQPHLVILNEDLPDRSGVDVLRQVKAQPHYSRIRVVMLTDDASCLGDLLRPGVDVPVSKPLDFPKVLEVSTRLLDEALPQMSLGTPQACSTQTGESEHGSETGA